MRCSAECKGELRRAISLPPAANGFAAKVKRRVFGIGVGFVVDDGVAAHGAQDDVDAGGRGWVEGAGIAQAASHGFGLAGEGCQKRDLTWV